MGGGLYSTHHAKVVCCVPVFALFVPLSQHSPDDSKGLSGSPLPPPLLPHAHPAIIFDLEQEFSGVVTAGRGGERRRGGGGLRNVVGDGLGLHMSVDLIFKALTQSPDLHQRLVMHCSPPSTIFSVPASQH